MINLSQSLSHVDAFDYDLPTGLIAQYPLAERSASRLLSIDVGLGGLEHKAFRDLLTWLRPKDVLIFNNTRVIPARLHGRKASGGRVELLVERILDDACVLAHIKASHMPKIDSIIFCESVCFKVIDQQGGLFVLQKLSEGSVLNFMQEAGSIPLPPYIERPAEHLDSARYQTVYADVDGAVAAPTAGLHFDESLLHDIKQLGVAMEQVTLHVGAGTFQPVRVSNLDQHHMHSERVEVNQSVCDAIETCRERGGRVVAVGTTVVRSLEAAAAKTGRIAPFVGDTDLFIRPGFQFQCVDALITNFHLPKSTLLMLVSAFSGYELMMRAYRVAAAERYRFFSYGDAMLIHHRDQSRR